MHPRPNLVRRRWLSLDGTWGLHLDRPGAEDRGARPYDGVWDASIVVPFPWESPASRVGGPAPDRYVRGADAAAGRAGGVGWYHRRVTIPPEWSGEAAWLVVGAAWWHSRVWIDGHLALEHDNGYLPFEVEASRYIGDATDFDVIVRVEAPADTDEYPHGKNTHHWYSRSSGIWQPVFLEPRPRLHVQRMRVASDPATATARIAVDLASPRAAGALIRAEASLAGEVLATSELSVTVAGGRSSHAFEVRIPSVRRWSPSDPVLYDIRITLLGDGDDAAADVVEATTGFRTIDFAPTTDGGPCWLRINDAPVYVRAVMSQGYHPGGILAYPDETTIRADLEMARRLGFNMVRSHVKVEDPRFLAWADRLGILVWEEVPDFLTSSPAARVRWEATWRGMIERDGGHPSIVVWCMFIESWGLGIDQFAFGRAERRFADDPETQRWVEGMYRLGRSLDPTRPIIENSVSEADHTVAEVNDTHLFPVGYGGLQAVTSGILDDYVAGAFPGSTHNFAPGWVQADQPLMVTSMAGWSCVDGTETSWPMRVLVNEVRARQAIAGYGWVQLYDVEWELTGLATYDRRPKSFGYDVSTLHSDDVLVVRGPLARTVAPGELVRIEVALAHASGEALGPLVLRARLSGLDGEGRSIRETPVWQVALGVADRPGLPLDGAITVSAPTTPFAGRVAVEAVDPGGRVVARTEVLLATLSDAAVAPASGSARTLDAPVGSWHSMGPGQTDVVLVDGQAQRVAARSLGFAFRQDDIASQGTLLLEVEAAVDAGAPAQTLVVQPTAPVRVLLDGRPIGTLELPLLCADTRGVLSIVFPAGAGSYGRWIGVELGELGGASEAGHELGIEIADPDLDASVVLFGPRLGSVPAGPRLRRGSRSR